MPYLDDEHNILIISNWFRTLLQSNITIHDICKIIIQFSKMYEQFVDYNETNVEVTKDGTVATVVDLTGGSIYCKLNIPNETKQIFRWKFKCWKMASKKFWGIGIDAIQNPSLHDDYFYNKYEVDEVDYLYTACGDVWECGTILEDEFTLGWERGDIVTLIYNGNNRELSISVDDIPDESSITKVEESEGGYRVAIYLGVINDKIEILQ